MLAPHPKRFRLWTKIVTLRTTRLLSLYTLSSRRGDGSGTGDSLGDSPSAGARDAAELKSKSLDYWSSLHHAPMAIPPSTVKLWPVMYAALSSVAMNLLQRRRKQGAHTQTHTHESKLTTNRSGRTDEAEKEVGKELIRWATHNVTQNRTGGITVYFTY